MMQTSTVAVRPASGGCGCGCGGAAQQVTSAFVRPRFFAGQLLTEDDLSALTSYITGKDRLRNRMLFGPGVVCGLEVACDPCGAGKVMVRPGYALDCCGNDIVVGCPEQVDINALVHDLRVRSLGVDCGDPCAKGDPTGPREYGLYIRYAEDATDLVAPYSTDESCPDTGCTPSRIRESYRFVAKCVTSDAHPYLPADRLTACLGDPGTLRDNIRRRADRLHRYRVPLLGAVQAAGGVVPFEQATFDRYQESLHDLTSFVGEEGEPQLPADRVRQLVEAVRALASAVASFDTYDADGQRRLSEQFTLDIDRARTTLETASGRLEPAVTDAVWSDPFRLEVAKAVLAETRERVLHPGTDPAPLELRMLALGAPLSYALRAHLIADLGVLREWLLIRLETGGQLTDCAIRPAVATVILPAALPETPTGDRVHPTATELGLLAKAAGALGAALESYIADCVCASILPPCGDCADSDVLLAKVQLDDCKVLRICAIGRAQWLPGGSGYAAWLPRLYRARALAAQVCCQPSGAPDPSPVPLTYVPGLLDAAPADTPLDELLNLLLAPAVGTAGSTGEAVLGLLAAAPAGTLTPGGNAALMVPGPTGPGVSVAGPGVSVAGPGVSMVGPAAGGGEVASGSTALAAQLAELRAQIGELTDALTALRAEQPEAGEAVTVAAKAAPAQEAQTGAGKGITVAPKAAPAKEAEDGAGAEEPDKPAGADRPAKKAAPQKSTRHPRGAQSDSQED
jgi:hypothetical protein